MFSESRKYLSGILGTYDSEYFIDPKTKKFRFPKYNKEIKKFLVEIKDLTNYREYYFDNYSKEEKERFSFNDFEKNIILPEFDIESFDDFLDRLSNKYFDDRIGKELSLDLFSFFEDYLVDEFDNKYIFLSDSYQKAIFSGYLEANISLKMSKLEYLNEQDKTQLSNLCVQNRLAPSKDRKVMLNRLTKIDFTIPNHIAVMPTERLKDYFKSLMHLYVTDIKKNADRFHPLFIESIWQETLYANYDSPIEQLIKVELSNKYWQKRIVEKWA